MAPWGIHPPHPPQATCKKFYDYCREREVPITAGSQFCMSYDTSIPRQLGLSGSSALIYAGGSFTTSRGVA